MSKLGDDDYVPPVCKGPGPLSWVQVTKLWEESPIFRRTVPVDVRRRMPEPYNYQIAQGVRGRDVCGSCYNGLGYKFVADLQRNGDYAVDIQPCAMCAATGNVTTTRTATIADATARAKSAGERMRKSARDTSTAGLPSDMTKTTRSDCIKCSGFGKVTQEHISAKGIPVATHVPCKACAGTGRFDPTNVLGIPQSAGVSIVGQDIQKPMNVW